MMEDTTQSAFHLHYADDDYPTEWRHIDGETLQQDLALEADVIIIGTGAGGGVSAEAMVQAGLSVILVEEGPLRTAKDFLMQESHAYPDLYQEAGARKTRDKGITILQGRSVGGSTTVNWTSSFRTPVPTLEYWQQKFHVTGHSRPQLDPYFDQMSERLGVAPWAGAPNRNNEVLAQGCTHLGWQHGIIARNVRGCANLGYCGMGCPMNAKQSMLTTTIPYALSQGATLLSRVRIDRLILDRQKVVRAEGHARNAFGQKRNALNADIMQHSAPRISLHAKHFIVAAGAIGSPALLLRSTIADPYQRIGKRTFLHPVVISTAFFDEPVNAWSGAPQSVYSDEFTFKNGVDGPCGYKLEVPPVHPVIASTLLLRHGHEHQQFMQQLPHMQAVLALLRDGFHEHSQGGQVTLDEHDDPLLDYPVTPYLFEAFQRALLSCAELQFAAGARSVMPLHKQAQPYASWQQARAAIKSLPMQLHQLQIFSAHVMGGCVMGEDEKQCVTDSNGRVRGMDNLSVHDGSLFPTSLGVNPQLTIYAIVRRLSEELTKSLAK